MPKIPTVTIRNIANLIARIPDQVAKVRADLVDEVARIHADRDLTPEAKAKRIAEAKTTAAAAVAELQASLDENRADLAEYRHRAETAARGDTTNDQLLAEMVEARGWDRARSMIDGGRTVQQVLEHAGRHGDVAMLAGIRSELAAHLAGTAMSGADPDEIAETATRLTRRIDHLLAPHVPELAAARAAGHEAEDAAQIAAIAVQHATDVVGGSVPLTGDLGQAYAQRFAEQDQASRAAAATRPAAAGATSLEQALQAKYDAPAHTETGDAA